MANILIGISGSIAAYKSVFLVRNLNKTGHKCKVIITKGGSRFVTSELIAGLGCEVYSDELINLTKPTDAMLHINLARWADIVLVAPASANTIAKIANGMANDLLSEMLLVANKKPRLIAPAMNCQMWANPLTQENIHKLEKYGFHICYPDSGLQACGDIGEGRMLEAEELSKIIENYLNPSQYLHGKTILLTLGATIEAIDPVRFISNHSSGKMGLALIKATLLAGANVIALAGKTSVTMPSLHQNLTIINTFTAESMLDEALKNAVNADLFIACAAVCDYRLKEVAKNKIKKLNQTITLELVKNPDILKRCKEEFPGLICVGFAAETDNLIENAIDKLKSKNLDLIVANQVGNQRVFGKDNTTISIIDRELNIQKITMQSKFDAAKLITHLTQITRY